MISFNALCFIHSLTKISRDNAKKKINKKRRGSVHAINLEERVSWWKLSKLVWRIFACCCTSFIVQYSCWPFAFFVHFAVGRWTFHFRVKFCQENIEPEFSWTVFASFIILRLVFLHSLSDCSCLDLDFEGVLRRSHFRLRITEKSWNRASSFKGFSALWFLMMIYKGREKYNLSTSIRSFNCWS